MSSSESGPAVPGERAPSASVAEPASAGPVTVHPPVAATSGLVLLTLLNLLNYLDRQVLPAILDDVKSALVLNDSQMGLLATAFLVVIMVASPVFGLLGDRGSRTRLLGIGAALWSLATVASGMASSFAHLLLARIAVGTGEAAYGTIAPALLTDLYDARRRGRVFAIFYAAIPVGAALGFAVGGLVNRHYGWRAAFLVSGLPGLVLAVWAWFMRDPPRGAMDEGAALEAAAHGPVSLGVFRELASQVSYVRVVLGYAAQTAAVGGLSFWMPTFLVRVRGIEKSEAAITFGLIVAAAGFLGSLGGGWLADAALARSRNAYLWVSGISTALAVPFCLAALLLSSRMACYGCIFVTALLIFGSTGPINAMIVQLVAPTMRASAVAAATVVIHLLGDAPANLCIGALSDALGLRLALAVLPLTVAVAGWIWMAEANRLDRAPVLSSGPEEA